MTYGDVGLMLDKLGEVAGALQSYRTELALVARLAKADPSDADFQSSLAVAYDLVGNALLEQNNLSEALASYQHALRSKRWPICLGPATTIGSTH